jgi:hypothetical protein
LVVIFTKLDYKTNAKLKTIIKSTKCQLNQFLYSQNLYKVKFKKNILERTKLYLNLIKNIDSKIVESKTL